MQCFSLLLGVLLNTKLRNLLGDEGEPERDLRLIANG